MNLARLVRVVRVQTRSPEPWNNSSTQLRKVEGKTPFRTENHPSNALESWRFHTNIHACMLSLWVCCVGL